MRRPVGLGTATALVILIGLLFPAAASARNKLMGEVDIKGQTKIDKTSGVWVDEQYVGFVSELKGNKRILLLPGEHKIEVRQAGYVPVVQKVMIQPGKKVTIYARMFKSNRAEFPQITAAQIKVDVKPNRAAVFVDGQYAGTPSEFSGIGHAMVLAPGKHQIRIALAGYRDFSTEVDLRPNQKMTIKTNLARGSNPGPAIGSD